MLKLFARAFPRAPAEIEMELIAKLLAGNAQIGITGAIACFVGIQAALVEDWLLAGSLLSVLVVAVARVSTLHYFRLQHGAILPDLTSRRRWVKIFAIGSGATSSLIGGTNLLVMSYRDPPLALLVVCTLCCYVFSLIVRTAVRPTVCLSSVMMALVPTLIGLGHFLDEGTRLTPAFAAAIFGSVAIVLVGTCIQLTGVLYRTTLDQLLAKRDLVKFSRQDPLTGIDNRLALRERFQTVSPEPTQLVALMYLDLDHFKPINDVHGHQVGDIMLREVAKRLTASLGSCGTAFRTGGDEFALLVWPLHYRSDAAVVARRVIAALSDPYTIEGLTVSISGSIGIALADANDGNLDDLAEAADVALYDAKRRGGGAFRFASDRLHSESDSKLF